MSASNKSASDPQFEQELLDYQALSAAERYAALVDAVARDGRFWVAESGEYLLTLFDADGQELLPAWPSAATARAALAQAPKLAGYAPAARELAAWRERAAAAMGEAGVGIGAFPDTAMQCAVVAPAQWLEHLDAVIADDDGGEAQAGATQTSDEDAPAALDLAQAQRALAQKFAKPRGD